jgi:hypothetical protein
MSIVPSNLKNRRHENVTPTTPTLRLPAQPLSFYLRACPVASHSTERNSAVW